MLVLTRRINEKIRIADNIVVTILEVRGDQVRLGIDAPRAMGVHREEVWIEMQAQNIAAASPTEEQVATLSTQLAEVMARAANSETQPAVSAVTSDVAPTPPSAQDGPTEIG